MKIQDYKKEWNKFADKKNLSGKEALEAVKQDGYALQYVREQTEEICLETVKEDGYALQYVSEDMFEAIEELTLEEVCKELGRDIKIIK